MKVLASFKTKDGDTPLMTADEINEGKYKEYGVSQKQFDNMLDNFKKTLVGGIT